jgi:hypothetical protein
MSKAARRASVSVLAGIQPQQLRAVLTPALSLLAIVSKRHRLIERVESLIARIADQDRHVVLLAR